MRGTNFMSYVEQRNEIIKQYRDKKAIPAYVVIGGGDYLTVCDIVSGREFIISRYEVEVSDAV